MSHVPHEFQFIAHVAKITSPIQSIIALKIAARARARANASTESSPATAARRRQLPERRARRLPTLFRAPSPATTPASPPPSLISNTPTPPSPSECPITTEGAPSARAKSSTSLAASRTVPVPVPVPVAPISALPPCPRRSTRTMRHSSAPRRSRSPSQTCASSVPRREDRGEGTPCVRSLDPPRAPRALTTVRRGRRRRTKRVESSSQTTERRHGIRWRGGECGRCYM